MAGSLVANPAAIHTIHPTLKPDPYLVMTSPDSPVAQHKMGLVYLYGVGETQDKAQAVTWFTLAAKQGFAPAQFNLGLMYDTGDGVAEDNALAVKWYRFAAKQGNTDAQGNLAAMYASGSGLLPDQVSAYMWASLASANGNELSERLRAYLAPALSDANIATAETMARDCIKHDFRGCH